MHNININFIRIRNKLRLRRCCALFLLFSSTVFYSNPTSAANLYDIAKEFINRVNPVYKEEEEFNPIDQIPDGGTLLLRPRSEKVFLGDEIYAIKKDGDIYLSLDDFINILNFAISYDDESLTGSGWFLREDWEIDLNIPEGQVTSRGQEYNVSPDDIYSEDGFNYVRTETLGEWFGLILDYDIQQQVLNIESPFPFPAVAQNKRDNNFRGRNDRLRRTARLPRLEDQPKSNFDINTADVTIGNRLRRDTNGNVDNRTSANVYAQGEFLQHNGYIFATGDDEENLRSLRGQLFKRSEQADLLGGLNARSYAIGDVREIRIPLASDANENFGFRFSNSTLENTDFATTNIEGNSFPGWDIQLYRNGVLIDTLNVGPDGRYVFENIQLFAGDNDFELFFFGPQGEIRAKRVSAPVSPALLSSQDNTYEVSATLEDTQTYLKNNIEDEDTNSININAKYNKLIGNNHLAYMGFRTRQINGDRKFFLSTGATSTLGQTLVDTNFAVDQTGEASAQAIVRRNLLGWNTSIRTQLNTDDFIYRDTTDPSVIEVALNAQRSMTFGGFKSSLLVDGFYRQSAEGLTSHSYSFGVSNSVFGTSVSNRIQYQDDENLDGTSDEELQHVLSLRKNFGRFFLSLGSTFNITPDSELDGLRAQLNYRYSNNLSADLTFNRQFDNDRDFYRLNMNYIHDKFRLSPFVQYSTDNDFTAGVGLNFSMYDDPNSRFPDFTNRRLASRGAVSAFVYHDKNGNHIFDEGDEPLENSAVESLTSPRRASTDAGGYATIPDLPVNRATDVVLNNDTLPDPFMLPATEGNSIMPVEGTIHNMEFPVHMTGEIDGTIYYFNTDSEDGQNNKIPAGFQDLQLISLDTPDREIMSIQSERDGYYVAYMIPPGEYLLTTANSNSQYGNTLPLRVSIGYDGPIIPDMDIQVIEDAPIVPYEVVFHKVGEEYNIDREYKHYLKVKKSGLSDLSQTLNTLIHGQNGELYEGLIEIDDYNNDKGQYALYSALHTEDMNNPEFLHNRCRAMQEKAIDCSIMVNSLSPIGEKNL